MTEERTVLEIIGDLEKRAKINALVKGKGPPTLLWMLRTRHGLTQAQLAEMACVSQNAVYKSERGYISPPMLERFARVFGFEGDPIELLERIVMPGALLASDFRLKALDEVDYLKEEEGA